MTDSSVDNNVLTKTVQISQWPDDRFKGYITRNKHCV